MPAIALPPTDPDAIQREQENILRAAANDNDALLRPMSGGR